MNSVDVAIGFVLRGTAERPTPDAIIQIYAIRAALRQRQLPRARAHAVARRKWLEVKSQRAPSRVSFIAETLVEGREAAGIRG